MRFGRKPMALVSRVESTNSSRAVGEGPRQSRNITPYRNAASISTVLSSTSSARSKKRPKEKLFLSVMFPVPSDGARPARSFGGAGASVNS